VLVNLFHVVVARLRVGSVTPAIAKLLLDACSGLVKKLKVLLDWLNALIDPPWYLTGIIVWGFAFKSKLSTLGTFARYLARWTQLSRSPKSMLYLLDLIGLEVDWLIDAFSVLHLLNFVATRMRNLAWLLLNRVDARIALWVGTWVVEVNSVCCEQVHLVFTCLAKATRIYCAQLKWLRGSDLSALTWRNDPRWVMTMAMLIEGIVLSNIVWVHRLHWGEVVITLCSHYSICRLLFHLQVRISRVG